MPLRSPLRAVATSCDRRRAGVDGLNRGELKWLVKKIEPRLRAITIKQLTTHWALDRMWANGFMPTTPDEVADLLRKEIELASLLHDGCDGVKALNAEARAHRFLLWTDE